MPHPGTGHTVLSFIYVSDFRGVREVDGQSRGSEWCSTGYRRGHRHPSGERGGHRRHRRREQQRREAGRGGPLDRRAPGTRANARRIQPGISPHDGQRRARATRPDRHPVNNAGIGRIEPFLDSEPGTWDRLLAVNLRGTIAMCHAVAPKMSERGTGRIVNVASDAGRVGSSGEVVYSGTKGGVTAFSNALARELARSDVTVDVVCPGPTDTAASTGSRSEPETYESLQRAIPFVASQGRWTSRRPWGSSHLMMPPISGQTLSVSGGLTMA
jgi:2-hydroxycyclohexanecarboxyl-CoA dehydrogenase